MAKKGSVNKSAAIRDYLSDHPDAGPSEVVTALKKDGISVSNTYVSSIKSTMKSAGKRDGRRRKKDETSPVQDVWHAGELMVQAVDLVMKAGVKEAKSLVDYASKVVSRVNEGK